MRRAWVSVAVVLAGNATAASLEMKSDGQMRWICAGVGAEERRELAALEPQANLKLLLVTEKRGGYLADVEVALVEPGASAPRLTLKAGGPICLIKAPAGRYRVEASFGGTRRSVPVTLRADPGKAVRAVLAFPGEAWDGIWASDEEKRGARE